MSIMETKGRAKKPETVVALDVFGKMPPQAVELEVAVLGACLIDNEAIYDIIDVIDVDTFYVPEHQLVFDAIKKISSRHQKVDILTVAAEMKSCGKLDAVGGEIFLSELTNRVATSAHLQYHARLIQQFYIKRRLISMGALLQRNAFDDSLDVDELIEFAESELFKITDNTLKKEFQSGSLLMSQSLDKLEERSKDGSKLNGIGSGFVSVDRITSGFQSSDLIILAARPSMGKTALALCFARNAAVEFKKNVALFSLEMSSIQLSDRLLSAEAEVSSDKIRNGQLQPDEWSAIENAARVDLGKLFIDDTASISIYELRAKCRRLKRTEGLAIVFIDYLQLMTTGKDAKNSREQEVALISRSLKALAKELDIPVVALSQLNRSVESRSGDKRPQLSDLRESGAIEQDADVVMFVHRPEYYGITEDEEGNSLRGIAELIVAKYRNGGVGTIPLGFKQQCVKFYDLEQNVPESTKEMSVSLGFSDNSDIGQNYDFYSNGSGLLNNDGENDLPF